MKRRKARLFSHLIMDYFASYPSSQKMLNISIDGYFKKWLSHVKWLNFKETLNKNHIFITYDIILSIVLCNKQFFWIYDLILKSFQIIRVLKKFILKDLWEIFRKLKRNTTTKYCAIFLSAIMFIFISSFLRLSEQLSTRLSRVN